MALLIILILVLVVSPLATMAGTYLLENFPWEHVYQLRDKVSEKTLDPVERVFIRINEYIFHVREKILFGIWDSVKSELIDIFESFQKEDDQIL